MDALQIIAIFFAVLNLTFAGFLIINSKRNVVVNLYALISIFAVLWTFSTLATGFGALSFQYLRFAIFGHYIFGYFAYLSFFWFAVYYPTPPTKTPWSVLLLTTATTLFLSFIPVPGFMFNALLAGTRLADIIVFNERGYISFILMLSGVFFAGLFILIRKQRRYGADVLYKDLDKYQIRFAIYANLVAGVLGITFNLIFPLFGNFSYFYINPIFVTGALTAIGLYNISRNNLFNARIFLAEFFIAGILFLSLTRLVLAPSGTERLIELILLGVFVGLGALLIQSVLREIRQREQIEKLASDLEAANRRQEGLIHFISHEVKGALGKCAGMLSLIIEGDYGPAPDKLRDAAGRGLSDTRAAVDMVSTILLSSNLKSGKMNFNMKTLNFLEDVVRPAFEGLQEDAERKGLRITLKEDVPDTCSILGDKDMLAQHVVHNLIDNAIKYTPMGDVIVGIRCINSKMVLSVTDSGVGITPADMEHLFTEGGRGRDSVKVNVNSTGYGLYFAKQLVDAHGGSIRAESEGSGKGSTFIVELPLAKIP